jgi:hypothetical protein
MKTCSLLFIGLLGSALTSFAQTLTIKNSGNRPYTEQVVEIPWERIQEKYPSIDTSNFQVLHATSKEEIVYQLEYKGAKTITHLLVQVSVPAKSTLKLLIRKGKHKPFAPKTYCRYVPERKDDFAWENDRIAFRMYGKALEGTSEDAKGIDVWVKRTDRLVLNDRYKRGEYHVDHGDGLDYYHVGFSLGAGNCAPFVKDSVWYSGNYQSYKILDNGPLRSTFTLFYHEWNVAGQRVGVSKTISLDAGSQLSKVEASYTFAGESLPIAIGIVKRPEPAIQLLDEQKGIMAYWEPEHGKDGITAVGTILSSPAERTLSTNRQLLTVKNAVAGKPLIYYTGAAWNKAGVFTSPEKWFEYLKAFQERLKTPLEVE